MTLVQSGNDFSGTTAGGTLQCVRGTVAFDIALGPRPVINGEVDGDRIEFEIGTLDWHNTGRINQRSMDGTAHILPDLGVPAPLAGPFGAARVPD